MLTLDRHNINVPFLQRVHNGANNLISNLIITLYKIKASIFRPRLMSVFNKTLLYSRLVHSRHLTKLPSLSVKEAKEMYPHIKRLHLHYSRFYEKMEKVNFLDNLTARKLAEEISDLHYQVESAYRKKAFSDTPVMNDDSLLTEFASASSVNSLQQIDGV